MGGRQATSAKSRERGVALVAVLLAVVLLTALGVGLVTLSDSDRVVAASHEAAYGASHAADAIAELLVHELAHVADWTDILNGSVHSSFRDVTTVPNLPGRGPTDLHGLTAALQAQSDAIGRWGADNPVWQLVAFGWLEAALPVPASVGRDYIVVWAADDSAETDGDPRRDENGVLVLLVRAKGQSGASQTRRLVVEKARFVQDSEAAEPGPVQFRHGSGSVRVLSWREGS